MNACWIARVVPDAGPCEGQLVKCHLIDKAAIKRAFRKGAVKIDGTWQPMVEARCLPDDYQPETRTLKQLQDDPRAWRLGCGGLTGLSGHHGRFDSSSHPRTRIVITREMIPPDTEEYAAELGLLPWLDHHYAPATPHERITI